MNVPFTFCNKQPKHQIMYRKLTVSLVRDLKIISIQSQSNNRVSVHRAKERLYTYAER